MTTNPTPKARFLESGNNVSAHRKMVDSTEFQRACDFALLQYTSAVTGEIADGNTAMYVGMKLLGVHQFINVLRNLAEAPPAPPRIVTPANLNHEA